jgi:branched-chain amino acid transport system permease protein
MLDLPWRFAAILVANGLLVGAMYALVALGFVLIYKATDAINFAQGEFVMFAGFLAAAAIHLAGAPWWASALLTVVAMIVFAFGLERVVLRRCCAAPRRWRLAAAPRPSHCRSATRPCCWGR